MEYDDYSADALKKALKTIEETFTEEQSRQKPLCSRGITMETETSKQWIASIEVYCPCLTEKEFAPLVSQVRGLLNSMRDLVQEKLRLPRF